MEAQNFVSLHRSKLFIGHGKCKQKPGFTTDQHSSLEKPLITQLYLCNSEDTISPFPLFSTPCWKTLTMKGSRELTDQTDMP